MEKFLKVWETEYKEKAAKIGIFTDAAKTLTKRQRQHFARLFYHARGHFKDFIWLVGSSAPTVAYRKVILENILDEMGGLDSTHVSHEQLYLNFALALDPAFKSELKTEKNYVSFLRAFNNGHIQQLLKSSWEEKWALFAAYELLDNADYGNLDKLVEHMNLPNKARVFFEVHRDGNHFGETKRLLEHLWKENPKIVKKSFEFIGNHQLKMWRQLSKEVFA
jgi:hypothetical protein